MRRFQFRIYIAFLMLIFFIVFSPISFSFESTGYVCLDAFIQDSRFASGVSWGKRAPILSSCQHFTGCLSYCADYTKYCFDIDDPRDGEAFYDATAIRAGDVIKVTGSGGEHWFVCLKREGNNLYIAEGNWGAYVRIDWSRVIKNSNTVSGIDADISKTTFAIGYHFDLESTQPDSGFTDVAEGSWYYDNVKYVVDRGLFNGVGNNKFQPNGTMTREMFVTVLYRLAGEPPVSGSTGFSDVTNTGSWYYSAVLWAKNVDVTSGVSETSFGVGNGLKRQDMITLMYRYAKQNGLASGSSSEDVLNSFYDAGKVSSYAREAMCWAVEKGILTGMSSTDAAGNKVTILQPAGMSTRAQVAAVIQRMVQ